MTREEADFIGAMNMCDEISNEAYKKIMCHCEEQQPCGDCISRTDALNAFKPKGISEELWMESNTYKVLTKLPSVTPKADSWSKLYMWLNDMHLGISPDEFTPDDERNCRVAQTDIIEDIMEWIEANVFEQKPKEDKE